MQKTLILLCLLMPAGMATAQYAKIEKLLNNGNTQKAGKMVSKLKKKSPKTPETYLWAMQVALAEVSPAAPARKQAYINAALKEWNSAEVRLKNQSAVLHPRHADSLKKHLHEHLNTLDTGKQQRQAKLYTQVLASLGDTTALWLVYFAPASPSTIDTVALKVPEIKMPEWAIGRNFTFPVYPPHLDSVIAFAQTFVGTPYKWAGADPKGFDCSGFVQYVMRNFGYTIDHHTSQIARLGTKVDTDNLQKGDIIFFGQMSDAGEPRISHVGIIAAVGPDGVQVIHSVNRGVCIDSLNKGYWASKILFAKRIIHDYSQYGETAGK